MSTASASSASAAPRQPVNTKRVTGRREVRYESFDEVLADAGRLAESNHRAIGNWTYSQILNHLTYSNNAMIDGLGFSLPAPARWLMSLLMKRRMLTKPLPAGFKIPKGSDALPQDSDLGEAMERFRASIARVKSEPQRAMHPGFGHLSREEWDLFQLRHAELHMSFVLTQLAFWGCWVPDRRSRSQGFRLY